MRNAMIGLLAAAVLWTFQARALTPQQILEKTDENVTRVQDQQYDAKMTIYDNDNVVKTISLSIALKGRYKKLFRFSGPSDVKGMAVLSLEDNVLYVYLPTYKKIRRVASHVTEQGFMGSDFDYDDMSQSNLSTFYNASMLGETPTEWQLKLTPKPGSQALRSRLDVTIRKSDFITSQITVYTETGAKYKTQIRSNFENHDGLIVPCRMEIVSHMAKHRTVLELTNVRSNKGLSDDVFSKRALMREE